MPTADPLFMEVKFDQGQLSELVQIIKQVGEKVSNIDQRVSRLENRMNERHQTKNGGRLE
jgi:hypothetical protein